jgi:hypothetical protein
MDPRRITRPDDLLITPEQLAQRLKPLLRKAGLCSTAAQWTRIRQNLNPVCWELALQWKAKPFLGPREVGFGEYLATKLGNTLRALDRDQNPDLYDKHGAYQPEGEPIELDEFNGKYFRFTPATPAATATNWTQPLTTAGRNAGIAQTSIAALIQLAADLESGKTKSPYKLARAQGLSISDARYQPATSAFIAIGDFINEYTPSTATTSG